MAWVAVSFVNKELVFKNKPIRGTYEWWYTGGAIVLPKGSIKKLIGRELTWADEPVILE